MPMLGTNLLESIGLLPDRHHEVESDSNGSLESGSEVELPYNTAPEPLFSLPSIAPDLNYRHEENRVVEMGTETEVEIPSSVAQENIQNPLGHTVVTKESLATPSGIREETNMIQVDATQNEHSNRTTAESARSVTLAAETQRTYRDDATDATALVPSATQADAALAPDPLSAVIDSIASSANDQVHEEPSKTSRKRKIEGQKPVATGQPRSKRVKTSPASQKPMSPARSKTNAKPRSPASSNVRATTKSRASAISKPPAKTQGKSELDQIIWSGAKGPNNPVVVNGEEEWEISGIRDINYDKGVVWLQWKGWDGVWQEPLAKIRKEAADLVREFEAKHKAEKASTDDTKTASKKATRSNAVSGHNKTGAGPKRVTKKRPTPLKAKPETDGTSTRKTRGSAASRGEVDPPASTRKSAKTASTNQTLKDSKRTTKAKPQASRTTEKTSNTKSGAKSAAIKPAVGKTPAGASASAVQPRRRGRPARVQAEPTTNAGTATTTSAKGKKTITTAMATARKLPVARKATVGKGSKVQKPKPIPAAERKKKTFKSSTANGNSNARKGKALPPARRSLRGTTK